MIRNILSAIGGNLVTARLKPFAGNPLAHQIRHDAPEEIRLALGHSNNDLTTKGSAGAGNWADVVWVAVFDPLVTASAQMGYYVVYLINMNGTEVHLSLNQGVTLARQISGPTTRTFLKAQAQLGRDRLPEFHSRFKQYELNLGSNKTLPVDYQAGHILGVRYYTDALPDEPRLTEDLLELIKAYRILTARGGLSLGPESGAATNDEEAHWLESKRYVLHRQIERASGIAVKVKKIRGFDCETCGFNFEKNYGALGTGYIEAHHLQPIAHLPEGSAVSRNPHTDFAVLCANCHRMMHRLINQSPAPIGIDVLQAILAPIAEA
jgi:5-methylcytosine-specific restriction protein A